MMRKRNTGPAVLAGFCAALAAAFCFVLPVRLVVDIDPEKAAHFEELGKGDVTVRPSALFRRGDPAQFRFVKESTDEYDDVVVATVFLSRRIHLRDSKITSLEASYTGTAVEGEPVVKSRVEAYAEFGDGRKEKLKDVEVYGEDPVVSRSSRTYVGTEHGVCELKFHFADAAELTASYTAVPYEGGRFDIKYVKAEAVLTDGTKETVSPVSCEGVPYFTGISAYTVFTDLGRASLELTPVRIRYMQLPGLHYAGESITGPVLVAYEDGSEVKIDAADLVFDKGVVLSPGKNEVHVRWNGAECVLYAYAAESNNVVAVRLGAADEISQSVYNSLTDSLFLTVRKVDWDVPYVLTHVAVADPSQMRVEPANGMTGGGTEPASSAAARTGWALGINGSFFDPATGLPLNGCVIRGGAAVNPVPTTGHEVCITAGGALFSPPPGIPAQDLIAAGVRDTLVTTDPLLLQDGQAYTEGSMDIAGSYPRTAVGMVEPGEYYILSVEGQGLSYSQMQALFTELGCSYARSLDGGSSVSLMFGQQAVAGGGRPVVDFLYFTPG